MNQESIELAIIINSYNRLPLLKKSLTSICKGVEESGLEYAVVIFDANSTDGSIEWMNDFKDKHQNINIKLIMAIQQEPDSFSYGVNAACNYSIKNFKNLKFLFLYETDNYISSFEPVVNAMKLLEENKDMGACGFTVKKHDGKNAGYGCSFPTLISFVLGQQLSFFFKQHHYELKWLSKTYGEYAYIDVVYTSPVLIKRKTWEKVRGFDSVNFPFSDSDIDLAYRMAQAGERMAILKSSDVIHDNLLYTSSWSLTRTINFYRARLIYFKKHFGKWINLLKPVLLLTHLLEFFILFTLLILGKRKVDSLKTRLTLIKIVFVDYKL